MIKIAALGDNVVDCYLSRDEMYPGGNCLNVSVFSRRFGALSAYIGAIGRDRAGDVIQQALEAEDIDVSHLRRLDGPTAYCVIGHRNAERLFLSFDLGVSMFAPDDDDLAFLETFSAVHVGQSSGLDAHLGAIAKRALLSYDFSIRREREHRRAIAPFCLLASVSGGDLSDDEVAAVSGELIDGGAQWVLVTRGRQGAMLAHDAERWHVAAHPIEAVDTLGAGDTFIARTLYGLLAGEDPREILSSAARAAADTCRYFGAVGHGAPIAIAADIDALKRKISSSSRL
ncbi:PfkB family carbohydrate kinase [Aestuariivirga sp. YIM B02566]|uniref:Ribokinase n=1 Tax=Taklimakanibacter albus TaxID=2800327 RepID=A0ACC5QYR3_9HYPH|nr:PfkB family carbohydrate kinase [Aestuariivirga sp. YIM B02566]MBK1865539.1 ribokinase [Aestuariivirga sp. YIM B02566]